MLKNVVVSFILICLIFAISFAQVEIFELEGWVKYQNKKPASGVTMSIGQYNIFTDQHGYYKISFLGAGEHVISISPPGRSIRPVRVIIKRNYPYQIDNNSNIWHIEVGQLGQLLDNSRSSIAITSEGNNLYQMRRDGTIWQYTGTAWEQLDDNPDDDNPDNDNYGILFHIHNNNNILYKILRNGEIQQYNPSTRVWNRLEHDPTTYVFFTNFIPERNILIVRKDFLIDW